MGSGNPRPGTSSGSGSGNPRPGTSSGSGSGNPRPGTSPGTGAGNPRPGTSPGTAAGNPRPGTSPGTAAGNPRPGTSPGTGAGNPRPGTSPGTGAGNPRPGGGINAGPGGTSRTGRGGTSAGPAVPTRSGGNITHSPGGRSTYTAPGGRTTAQIHNGRPTMVKNATTTIHRPAGGTRVVVAQRGNRTVVVRGAGRGYVEHSIRVRGQSFAVRTHYVRGVAYASAYRHIGFGGMSYGFYAPMRYYPVGFYGWALDPWASPLDYPWGWRNAAWYGYYGSYFQPFPVYGRPSLWLTDYLIANTLQAAFQARDEARAAAQQARDMADNYGDALPASEPMSDEVKEMIAQEVDRQLAEARIEAQQPQRVSDAPPPAFTDGGSHLFLANDSVEVENASTGETCVIGEGDAIQLNGLVPSDGGPATVMVRASKGSNCPVNTSILVPVSELVEMHNSMRETIEQGLATLHNNQDSNLPRLPNYAQGAPVATTFSSAIQKETDQNVGQLLQEEARQADQMEASVMADYGSADPGIVSRPYPEQPQAPAVDTREAGLMASIQNGQTEAQVIAILGQPLNSSFQGGLKKLYQYRSGSITFVDGEVNSVEVSSGFVTPAPRSFDGGSPQSGSPQSAPGGGGMNNIPSQPASGSRGGVTIGMTESQVIATMGQPLGTSFLGGLKKVYEYRGTKVIFTDGIVSEVQ